MQKYILLTASLMLYWLGVSAQCPGCVIDLPNLPEDTLFLTDAPDGVVGVYYDGDLSFRMPKTTTPVAATDPDVLPGLNISEMTISSVSNLPPGLSWEPNQTSFNPDDTDGCGKICGVPLLPGLYNVDVIITAQVVVLEQTSSFSFPILILPGSSVTEGFTLENGVGCGTVTPSITNNIPSDGADGFQYSWDFGEGTTSTFEEPPVPTYTTPGVYEVNYQAIIDTFGYFLDEITILDVDCNDVFGGAPDLFVQIYGPDGSLLYQSPIDDNSSLPVTFDVNLFLLEGEYEIGVLDDDQGVDGGDDICGSILITQNDNGELSNGPLSLDIEVLHPVDTVTSVDTVIVFEQPDPPVVSGIPNEPLCEGDVVVLETNYDTLTQWYQDTSAIFEANGSILSTEESGLYWVTYTSPDGCSATSDTIDLIIAEPPNIPVFLNTDNLLTLFDPYSLPANYSLQWYYNGSLIMDATDIEFCIDKDGTYTLEVMDEDTDCLASYSLEVAYNPMFPNCMPTSTDEALETIGMRLYPNPASHSFYLEGLWPEDSEYIQLYHSSGALCKSVQLRDIRINDVQQIDIAELPSGFYFVELATPGGSWWGKLIIE
jgi:hypothetical protein